ncbi:MAG TPA: Flp family type IVb pilin [Aliidongia sp.]|nr:Flp family type IVb pilin [Aliidongia sp.]
MFRMFRRLSKDQAGSNAVEYGLIVAIISLGIVLGANRVQASLNTMFTSVSTQLTTAAT